jgi:hypothetical protein
MKLRLKRASLALAISVLIILGFFQAVSAPPVMPIGATTQESPFESNPTSHEISGVSATNPTWAYDGDFDYRASFKYDVTGFFELKAFASAPPTTFDIGWVDIKIRYEAAAATDDKYRIVYYVGAAGPVVLKDWTSAAAPAIVTETLAQSWYQPTNPSGDTWTWDDVGDVRVRFETERVNTADAKTINVYDVWLSVYPAPLPPADPAISVQPSALIKEAFYDIFFVDVYVTDVSEMWGYEFTLYYNTSVLWAEEYWTCSPFFNPWPSEINNTGGYVSISYSMAMAEATGFTGSTPIARIYFSVMGDGTSLLDLRDTKLPNVHAASISHTVKDGFFANVVTHDVAVTDVTVSQTCALPGEIVTIQIAVANEGTFTETFDVTVKYDNTIMGTRTVENLLPGASETLSFSWDTFGVSVGHYWIKAEASTVPGETDLSDNIFFDGTVTLLAPPENHDVAITYVGVSSTIVMPGQYVTIYTEVWNQGTESETFNVTVFYDNNVIGMTTVWNLLPGEYRWLSFQWNTTGVAKGAYTIRAEADVVPEETDTADNTYIDGIVTVFVPRISISPTSGPVGTKVTVKGYGFPPGAGAYLTFDDNLIGIIYIDAYGNFTASFSVPFSEAGLHSVKVSLSYYPTPIAIEASFTVIDVKSLDVTIDVGAIFFKGETAEFYVQTALNGKPIDISYLNATLYKPDGTIQTLTYQRISTGFYKIKYTLSGKGTMTGTYTLVAEASSITSTVNAYGTSIKTFLVKPTWEREAPKIAAFSISSIALVSAMILLWKKEKKKLL